MAAASQQVLLERMNDCIFYQSSDNWNNHRSHDEETNTCRKQGKKDICEDSPFQDYPEQIDVNIYGIGTFDCQIYLCRIYKVNESCILGNKLV